MELQLEKTKIIYVGTDEDPVSKTPRKFTFLSCEYKPRKYAKHNKILLNLLPAIGTKSLKNIRETVDGWKLHSKTIWQLKAIAKEYETVSRMKREFQVRICAWITSGLLDSSKNTSQSHKTLWH